MFDVFLKTLEICRTILFVKKVQKGLRTSKESLLQLYHIKLQYLESVP